MNDVIHTLFSFEGRLRRRDFWLSVIGLIVVSWILRSIIFMVYPPPVVIMSGDPMAQIAVFSHMSPALWLVNLLLLWPSIAVNVKRAHDRGKSGWWVLVACIPILGWLWWLIDLGILDGTPGPNQFGPSPKGLGAV